MFQLRLLSPTAIRTQPAPATLCGRRKAATVMCLLAIGVLSGQALGDELAPIQPLLSAGQLQAASQQLEATLVAAPDDQQARFSLGVVQFLQAIEGLGRDHYRYGLLGNRRRQITFMRLPVPENPQPEQLSYEGARDIIRNYVTRLGTAASTLSQLQHSGVKLPLQIGEIRLDLDGNGRATDAETFWRILEGMQGPRQQPSEAATAPLTIAFDDADAVWLQGYCHLMSALGEIVLAYNWQDQFERTAHLFYPRVDSPYAFLQDEGTGLIGGFNPQNLLDVIALIHTINYEVAEPERMRSALTHLETVIQLSRRSFALINAETDNDREWIPNANQVSAMGGLQVGQGIVNGWATFLDELELILQGKKLLPFWRGIEGGIPLFVNSPDQIPMHPELGINVRRIFLEPRRFDAMLWLQGTGCAPYLEKGERINMREWQEMTSAFEGEFVTFMLWFN